MCKPLSTTDRCTPIYTLVHRFSRLQTLVLLATDINEFETLHDASLLCCLAHGVRFRSVGVQKCGGGGGQGNSYTQSQRTSTDFYVQN